MFDILLQPFFRTVSALSGQPISPDLELKAQLVLSACVFLLVFSVAFFVFYRKQFWHEESARRLFWWTVLILGIVVAGKVAISYIAKGYVPDRMLFYGLPSPKFGGVPWLLPIIVSLIALYRYRLRSLSWPAWKFLLFLWCIFALFSVGVAGIREGSASITDPFTRDRFEYAGYLPHIQNTGTLLREYVATVSDSGTIFAEHSKTHPPGNVLMLYLLQKLFGASLFGLALLVTAIGGLCLFPVYYFWKRFVPEEELRTVFPVFVFLPSVVMFSATSMDIMTPLFFWLALAVSFAGWEQSRGVAFAGGLLMGVALLMNFLFLAFGLVFLFFLVLLIRRAQSEERLRIGIRALWSLLGFIGFFAALQWSVGYSLVENFFAAQSVHGTVVASGTSSALHSVLFAGINVVAFFLYLGIPHIVLFFKRGIRHLFLHVGALSSLGFYAILIFVLSGLFQGEVERIWLFLTPLFILPICHSIYKSATPPLAVISLLILQIITLQTLFYTYW